VTPKRPYPDGYPSEQEGQAKEKGGRFPSQIKKLTHLGGNVSAASIIMHQDEASKQRGYGSIARAAPNGQGLLPSSARRNHRLPPCVDAIDDALPIDSGTQHDNVGNTASIPCTNSKIFSQTIGKRKDAARASFLHFYA